MIVCVGGAVLDRKYRAKAPIVPATSNPANGFRSFGGVGRNICENLARLGANPAFVSLVGDDENGRALVDHLRQAGANVDCVRFSDTRPTAEYVAILEPGNDLALGIADMAIFEDITPALVAPALAGLGPQDWVLFDCNLPQATIEWIVDARRDGGFRIACDTVSTIKATKIAGVLGGLDLLFTNRDEARALLGSTDDDEALAQRLNDHGVANVVLTRGPDGMVIATIERLLRVAAIPARPLDVTGAGDALVAGTINALSQGRPLAEAVREGALLAALTIESVSSVLPDLSPGFLSAAYARISDTQTLVTHDGE